MQAAAGGKLRSLEDGEIDDVYRELLERGNKGFPHREKFLEVLNGYWNFELRPALQAAKITSVPTVGGVSPFVLLKEGIVAKWNEARAEPGASAGGLAAEALAQPVMQATLKSFHFAGVKRAGFGSEAAMEVVSLAHDRHVPNARVFLREDMSFLATYRYLQDHKKLIVGDLVAEEGGYDLVPDGERDNMPRWWNGARAGRRKAPPRWTVAVRLRLNATLLHQYRITPTEIAAAVEAELNEQAAECYCLGSPVAFAEVYVLAGMKLTVDAEKFGMPLMKGKGMSVSSLTL